MPNFSSRQENIVVFIFFIAISAAVLYPFLFQERLMLSTDSDALYYYYPTFDFYSRAIKNGESFLWNPLLLSGFPTYLSQSAGFFDPINIIIAKYFSSSVSGYNFRLFLDFLLVLAFSYLAGRSFGISKLASIFIGTSYLLAFHWRFLSNLVIANSLFVLPLIFYAFNKCINSYKKWRWILLGGLGLGLGFLGGYAQFIIYAIFLLGLYALIYFFFIDEAKKSLGYFTRFFAPILLMTFIGFLIGLPQILPALEFTPLTIRSGGLDYSATTFKVIEPGDISLFLFPDYSYFPYLSSGRKPLYLGAFWFLAAVAGFFIGLERFRKGSVDKKSKIAVILFSLFAFSLIASIKWSPIFYFMNKLPVFEYFRFPYRWMYLGIWFLAIIGAWGFDSLKDYSNNAGLRKVFKIASALIGAIIIAILLLNFGGDFFWSRVAALLDSIFSTVIYGKFGFDKDPGHYLEAIQRGISAWQEFVSLRELEFFAPFSILIGGSAIIYLFIWGRLDWARFRILGFALTLLTFFSIFMVQWPNSIGKEKISDYQSILSKFVGPEDFSTYRTYPFMLDYGFSKLVPPKYAISKDELMVLTDLQFASGWPNIGFYSNMPSVDGYEPFIPKDLFLALGEIGSTHGGEDYTRALSKDEKIERLVNNLDSIGMMGGKYIISGVKLNHKDVRFLGEENVTKHKIPIYFYENLTALPKFYFAKQLKAAPGQSLGALLGSAETNFQENSYLDCANCKSDAASGSFEVLSYRNGYIKIKAKAFSPGWLVVSESNHPGWSAAIDGRPVTIIKANGLYIGLFIPEGDHVIELIYKGVLGEENILRYFKIIR